MRERKGKTTGMEDTKENPIQMEKPKEKTIYLENMPWLVTTEDNHLYAIVVTYTDKWESRKEGDLVPAANPQQALEAYYKPHCRCLPFFGGQESALTLYPISSIVELIEWIDTEGKCRKEFSGFL